MLKFNLRLNGIREQIEVPKLEADYVSKLWEDSKVPDNYLIKITGITFKKSEIKSLKSFNDNSGQEDRQRGNDSSNKITSEYTEYHKKINLLSPEEKAKRMEFFKTFYHCFSGFKKAPEDLKIEVYNRQLKFFRENPRRIYTDPQIFKDLVPKPLTRPNDSNIKNYIPQSYSRIIEGIVASDRYASKHL